MAWPNAVCIIRRLGSRQPGESGTLALFGHEIMRHHIGPFARKLGQRSGSP
jgi:hypothetical protein